MTLGKASDRAQPWGLLTEIEFATRHKSRLNEKTLFVKKVTEFLRD
jgi:hypothetical protein